MLWAFISLFAIFMTINAIIAVALILIWDYVRDSKSGIESILKWWDTDD